MAKRKAAELTESEAPETLQELATRAGFKLGPLPEPEPPLPVCDHCNVPMRPGATGLAFCPSCYRAQRDVQA